MPGGEQPERAANRPASTPHAPKGRATSAQANGLGVQNPSRLAASPERAKYRARMRTDGWPSQVGGSHHAPSGLCTRNGDLPDPGRWRCEKFGWRRPLRSARLAKAPETAHLKVCASPLTPDFFTPSLAWALLDRPFGAESMHHRCPAKDVGKDQPQGRGLKHRNAMGEIRRGSLLRGRSVIRCSSRLEG